MRWAAVLGGVGATALLLFPVPVPPAGRLWQSAGAAFHVLLYAGLAWILGRSLSARSRSWPLFFGLMAFAAAVEWLQPRVGRSAELADWLWGVGGTGCICATGNRAWKVWLRWFPVLGLCLLPLAWELTLLRMEVRAFPVLADSRALWSRRGWELNSVQTARANPSGFRVEADSDEGARRPYPGLFRRPACPDWRSLRALRADLYWPAAASAIFAIRVDDRPGNPPYAERFQQEFSVTQGWNSVQIFGEQIRQTSGGRPMRLETIWQWGVFLVSDVPLDYFLLGTVRIEWPEEHP